MYDRLPRSADTDLTFFVFSIVISQRSVPKGHEGVIGKMRDQLEEMQDERDVLEDHIAMLRQGKKKPKKLDPELAEKEEGRLARQKARHTKRVAEAKAKREREKADRDKLRAAGEEVPPSEDDKDDENFGVKEKKFSLPAGQLACHESDERRSLQRAHR